LNKNYQIMQMKRAQYRPHNVKILFESLKGYTHIPIWASIFPNFITKWYIDNSDDTISTMTQSYTSESDNGLKSYSFSCNLLRHMKVCNNLHLTVVKCFMRQHLLQSNGVSFQSLWCLS